MPRREVLAAFQETEVVAARVQASRNGLATMHLSALIRSVAQATVELIADRTGDPALWRDRDAYVAEIERATIACAHEEPEGNPYAELLDALGGSA